MRGGWLLVIRRDKYGRFLKDGKYKLVRCRAKEAVERCRLAGWLWARSYGEGGESRAESGRFKESLSSLSFQREMEMQKTCRQEAGQELSASWGQNSNREIATGGDATSRKTNVRRCGSSYEPPERGGTAGVETRARAFACTMYYVLYSSTSMMYPTAPLSKYRGLLGTCYFDFVQPTSLYIVFCTGTSIITLPWPVNRVKNINSKEPCLDSFKAVLVIIKVLHQSTRPRGGGGGFHRLLTHTVCICCNVASLLEDLLFLWVGGIHWSTQLQRMAMNIFLHLGLLTMSVC